MPGMAQSSWSEPYPTLSAKLPTREQSSLGNPTSEHKRYPLAHSHLPGYLPMELVIRGWPHVLLLIALHLKAGGPPYRSHLKIRRVPRPSSASAGPLTL